MWRAAAIFLGVLPSAGLVAWWLFFRRWRQTPLGQVMRKAAERAEQERIEDATERLRDSTRRNGH